MKKKLELLMIEHKNDLEAFYADWCKQNASHINSLKGKAKNELIHLLLETIIEKDCLDLLLKKAQEQYEAQKELAIGTEIIGEFGLKKAKNDLEIQTNYHQNVLGNERAKKRQNLDLGREKGTQERKHIAKRKHKQLHKAIDDLLVHEEWRKSSNSKIAKHLFDNSPDLYRYTTTLRYVKDYRASLKKAESKNQA